MLFDTYFRRIGIEFVKKEKRQKICVKPFVIGDDSDHVLFIAEVTSHEKLEG